jgi:RimJ/RimL family protein N-acetyltransferase
LVLRAWRDADIEPWVAMNSDRRVTEFLGREYSRALSEASAAAMRRTLEENGFGWWAVEIRGSASFAGVIALQAVPFSAPFTPANEIGWRLSFESWGRGYATEGAKAALDFAFNELKWSEVVAFTAATNLRSQRVMQRLGMTYDPADDFEHPKLDPSHPLRHYVLYRIHNPH